MKLSCGRHLISSLPVGLKSDWVATFTAVERHTAALRLALGATQPLGLSLPLSWQAASQLSDPATLKTFQIWLDKQGCYVCSLEAWTCGARFRSLGPGQSVTRSDWTSPDRLRYTKLLLDLLAALVPDGVPGTVQAGPGAFKQAIQTTAPANALQAQLWSAIEHVDRLQSRTHKVLRLSLSPEPEGYLANSTDVALFVQQLQADRREDDRLETCLGVAYDTCHTAVAFEQPAEVLSHCHRFGLALTQIRLGAALSLSPTPEARQLLQRWLDQGARFGLVSATTHGRPTYYPDLRTALAEAKTADLSAGTEWRVHLHWPLASPPPEPLRPAAGQLDGWLDGLRAEPGVAPHLLLDPSGWDAPPLSLPSSALAEQLAGDYRWVLERLQQRGLS